MQHIPLLTLLRERLTSGARLLGRDLGNVWPMLAAIGVLLWLIGLTKTVIVVAMCFIAFAVLVVCVTPVRTWWRNRKSSSNKPRR